MEKVKRAASLGSNLSRYIYLETDTFVKQVRNGNVVFKVQRVRCGGRHEPARGRSRARARAGWGHGRRGGPESLSLGVGRVSSLPPDAAFFFVTGARGLVAQPVQPLVAQPITLGALPPQTHFTDELDINDFPPDARRPSRDPPRVETRVLLRRSHSVETRERLFRRDDRVFRRLRTAFDQARYRATHRDNVLRVAEDTGAARRTDTTGRGLLIFTRGVLMSIGERLVSWGAEEVTGRALLSRARRNDASRLNRIELEKVPE